LVAQSTHSREARDRNNPASPRRINLPGSIIAQEFHPIGGSSPIASGLRQEQVCFGD
jgi:hypothetical protein